MDALTDFSALQVLVRVAKAQERNRPVRTFAQNPPEALMADTLHNFVLKGRHITDRWFVMANNDSVKVNTDVRMVCDGGTATCQYSCCCQAKVASLISTSMSTGPQHGRVCWVCATRSRCASTWSTTASQMCFPTKRGW